MASLQFDFQGKTALITGAGRGIGEAVARGMASLGARVILIARTIQSLEAVASSINDDGGDAHPIACHTGHPEEIASLFERIRVEFGGLDILVNNAATNPFYGPAVETPEWAFDKTMEVNIKGYFLMCQNAAKLMLEGERGVIVNVASIVGMSPVPGQVIYGMSKAAVISMTRGFAKELGPRGIRVNAIAPGIVETRFAEALTRDENIQRLVRENTPLRRWAQADEIVASVLYLASDLSSYTTGAVLVVDGGMSS